MGYAIKAYLTEEAGAPIRRIWADIAAAGLGDFMIRSGSKPGLTLGVWENLSLAQEINLIRLTEDFAQVLRFIPRMETYGAATFPTDPAHVFLGVVPSTEVISLHKIFHGINLKLSALCEEYYRPGSWVPHSTLSLRCEPKQMIPILQVCLRHKTRLEGPLDSVGLIETSTTREIVMVPFSKGITKPVS
jgi:hypothetical protein